MAIPTKEELKAQRELKEYLKTLSKDSEVFTGLAGGFAAVGRGVSTVSKVAKTVKNSKRGKEAFNQLASKLKSFQSTTKKAKSTVKEVVEKKPTIPTTVPSTMELAQIPGSSAKTIKEGIKSFTGEAEKFVPKTNRLITRANSRAGNLKPFKDITTKPGSTPMNYTPTDPSRALSVKELPEILFKYKADKVALTTSEKIKLGLFGTAFTGLLGGAAYQGYKSTKVGESKLDLNKINENDLRDSKVYKDVKIIKTSTGDKGIIKDPTTGKWKYFNKDKDAVLLTQKKVGLGDGPPIGLGDKTNTKDSDKSSGTGAKSRSATGQSFDKAFAEARKQAGGAAGIFEWNGKKYGTALKGETVPKDRVEVGKTTAPLMGDDYYKKDPRLEILRQQYDDRQLLARAEAQKKEMKEFKPTESLDVLPVPTKPLSSLIFKTSALNPKTNSRVEPVSYDTIDIVDTKSKKLNKKRYGGNLAMLKYMKK